MDPETGESRPQSAQSIPPPPSHPPMTQRHVYGDTAQQPEVEEEEEYEGPLAGSFPPEKRTRIARIFYIAGFGFLPLLWIMNYVLFRPVFGDENTPRNVVKYAKWSLLGSIIVLSMVLVWIFMYQFLWNTWGPVGEAISVIIPKGV